MENLRTKREQTQAKIDFLGSSHENEAEPRRLQQLRKNLETDYDNAKKEVAALEKQENKRPKNTAKERATIDKLRKDMKKKQKEMILKRG